MQSTVYHQPWNTETKGFLSIYESFVSPQTIANIQNVLIESLYTLKSIRKGQRSALLTKNKPDKDVILVMSSQAWGKGIRSICPRAQWEWQSPIQFRHQSGAFTTELLSVVDSIYIVRTYISCGVKFLREFNFADRRLFFLRLENIGFSCCG